MGLQKRDDDIAALKLLLCRTGLVSAAMSGGLVARLGRPPTKTEIKLCRREAAASTVLTLCKIVQGPSLADNIETIVDLAVREDPSVRDRLIVTGGIPTEIVRLPDKRFNVGYREERQRKLLSSRTGALWQMKTGATASCIKELRKMGGKGIIDRPEALFSWTLRQPELPRIEFVVPGQGHVWTPPLELFDKLEQNNTIQDNIRWTAPYDNSKTKQVFVWYGVSNAAVAVCVMSRAVILDGIYVIITS
jgi:hypothetical protein